jgi:S-formylglutathione hydrolase FrmB
MGGYGAIIYAERDARLFKAAASYSGALDVIPETKRQPNADDIARWGDPASDASNWDAHDPLKMLPQLRGTALYISYGNGQPGPLDPAGADKDLIETQVDQGNLRFTDALTQADIPATVDAYGPGTHSWPYWNRELRASLPIMLAALGQPSGPLLPSTAASAPAASAPAASASAPAASASAPASPVASY